MSNSPDFVNHCLELLEPLGSLRVRRFFGGHGIYVEDLFIAIVYDERLFLKVDAESRPAFERAGCSPFVYVDKDGHSGTLSYFSPPDEAIESPMLMQPWARLALAAALRARAATAAKASARAVKKVARKVAKKVARKAARPARTPS
jgi:DNA transformation protein